MSLILDDVTLTYPDGGRRLTALDAVDLSVPAGGLTAVIGPSGSGKSSLLAVAATLVAPDRGRVVIDGLVVSGMRRRQRTTVRRGKVGMVFQQPNLLASLTAVEQLQVMAHLAGRSPRAAGDVRSSCWRRSGSPTRPTAGRTSSRAGSASGSTSPAR